MKTLSDFINAERDRFEIRHNNMFAKSFEEAIRYFLFLQIISKRHQEGVKEFAQNFTELQKSLDKSPGSHTYSEKQMLLDSEIVRTGNLVQLEVESFYQFAKILLDKIAVAVEFYFGKIDSNRIDAHHRLVEMKDNGKLLKIEVFANSKSISISGDLIKAMKNLQIDVSNFRDNYVTHLQSPRTIRGTSVDGRQMIGKIYPKNKEDTILQESKSLAELEKEFEEYINLLVKFMENNRDKTALDIKVR